MNWTILTALYYLSGCNDVTNVTNFFNVSLK
nr:MAG TPA: hypothetical protein [Caudoviricetes sp.]DAW38975.1 MAG TPA: hypothetical protein [Caudoviricetes sp.]